MNILILAPHLVLPARNGADLLVERNARALSALGHQVTVLAASGTLAYHDGTISNDVDLGMHMRRRSVAGLRTLAFRSNFFKEKFLTPSWCAAARQLLANASWTHIVCSYIVTATLVTEESRPVAVWTHNDEFKWFSTLASAAGNPLGRMAAEASGRWTEVWLKKHARQFLYVHVTETDQDGFHQRVPDMNSMVQPIGTDIPDEPASPVLPNTQRLDLLFVGSLSVTMNGDALRHFAAHFWPAISSEFGEDIGVTIAGSHPSDDVVNLCRAAEWTLQANVSDEELRSLYDRSSFTVLPFPYATGAKLKMLGSLAHGVPFLATAALHAQQAMAALPCLLSDNVDDWMEALRRMRKDGLDSGMRHALQARVQSHSWTSVARQLVDRL